MTIPSYSGLDRTLHYAAFSAIPAQIALADMERSLFGRKFTDIPVRRPVFVTALPRAGTTLLLYVLAKLPDFATHTYRDMPFVLTPLLWTRISASFRKTGTAQERAHGDGLSINYDSPEAFEEIVWKACWPGHYQEDRIRPWNDTDQDSGFTEFLSEHMRKIIALRTPEHGNRNDVRYLSKNNANISRLNILTSAFPEGRIFILLRHPWHHAESLRHQHHHFTNLHATDTFSRRYMEWLGHYEFGAALKPIDFDQWMTQAEHMDSMKPDFWLTYWYAAYSAVQKALLGSHDKESITLIDYDHLCHKPEDILPALAERLELRDPETLLANSDQFRPARTYEIEKPTASTSIYRACEDLYDTLRAQCIKSGP